MNRFRTLWALLCIGAAIASLTGCAGGGGAKRYAVSGEVKWRSQPLDKGGITFLPADPSLGASGGAMIKDGRYSIPAKDGLLPGRYKVMISSADPSKAADPDALPGPSGPLPKDRIEPKYNAETVLTAEVKAEGPNTFNFDVD
jgi:hypothetical protein